MSKTILSSVFILLICLISNSAFSQDFLDGTVFEKEDGETKPLYLATIYWAGTTIATTTDDEGYFKIDRPEDDSLNLVVRFVSYTPDTILITDEASIEIILERNVELKTVTIIENRPTSFRSFNTINTEILDEGSLKKAACCNLSESFQTNATVDVSYADAITGAKQIQMLGLQGVYTQLMTENVPSFRGLATTYGIEYIPQSWLESIQIIKGPGSVVNGYESMTGQINVELKKPQEEKTRRFYLNLYAEHTGDFEASAHVSHKFNKKLYSLLSLHTHYFNQKLDHNHDGFIDDPLTKFFSGMNRWYFEKGQTIEGQFGVRGFYDRRRGGQLSFDRTDEGSTNAYGSELETKRVEYFQKIGFLFPKHPMQSIGTILSGIYHQQNSFFGLKRFDATEKSVYANIIYQNEFSAQHLIKAGVSFLTDDYDQLFTSSVDTFNHDRTEIVPGIFSEYTFKTKKDNLTSLVGLRADYHNLYGVIFSPRYHMKWRPWKNTSIRFAAGKGMRVANIFADNIRTLANSRDVEIIGELKPEVSTNVGISFQQEFTIDYRDGGFIFDVYRVDYLNQVIVDLEDPQMISFYNLNGKSFANNIQTELNYEVIKNLTAKVAYKWQGVRSTYDGELISVPLVPQQTALFNVEYSFNMDMFNIDFTAQYIGEKRLLSTEGNPEDYQRLETSPEYITLMGQIMIMHRNLEIYVGCENITGYKQHDPIIAADNPFSEYFDATNIYAPIFGRKFYGGLRYYIR